jgi:hypothetical protein
MRPRQQRSPSPTIPAKVPGWWVCASRQTGSSGPTSEPFEGTNLIGRVIDTEKLKKVKERENVYIREVKQ